MPRSTRQSANCIALLAAAGLLAGCGDEAATAPAATAEPAAIEPATQALRLLGDPGARAEAAVAAYLEEREIREVPEYRDGFVDLDGDGTDEVLVYLDDPNWCRPAGCRLLVFGREEAGTGTPEADAPESDLTPRDTLLAEIAPVGAPVRVATQTHAGWRDLLVTVGGNGVPVGTVALQHDGIGYPEDPTLLAALAPDVVPDGVAAID